MCAELDITDLDASHSLESRSLGIYSLEGLARPGDVINVLMKQITVADKDAIAKGNEC